MDTPARAWLADLVLHNIDALADELATVARQRFPLYAALPPEQVLPLFVALYQVVAQSLAQADIAPLRTYFEQVTARRIRAGASADGFIQLAAISQEALDRLIARESADNPERAAAARHAYSTIITNTRLILSEINLRLLTHPPEAPPAAG